MIADINIELQTASRAIVRIGDRTQCVRNLLGAGDASSKLRKNSIRTVGLGMVPARIGGIGNVCPHSTAGCRAACLNVTGLGAVFSSVQFGRLARRMLWHTEREWFLRRLNTELRNECQKARRVGQHLAARLNLFSDIPWERYGVIDDNPRIRFYDYTKNPRRAGLVRENYWVTFSRSESNDSDCLRILESGGNVAVTFAQRGGSQFVGKFAYRQQIPESWHGWSVVDGDKTDLRDTDPRGGYVIGLRLKSHSVKKRMEAIESGFPVLID